MLRKKDQLGQLQERSLASDSNPHQGYRALMRREAHTSRSKILESLFMEFHHAQTGRAVDTANYIRADQQSHTASRQGRAR